MANNPINLFFTEEDNDFILKGARDPLGFQTIWQQTARPLIPYLNTVCGNLRDWQILCLGHALHAHLGTSEDIIPFFLRFEQLMAHTRLALGDDSFNGVEKTKRLAEAGGKTRRLGNNDSCKLLQNQRSYGIWGKYISPFVASGIRDLVATQSLFSNKISAVLTDHTAARLLSAVAKREGATVRADELEALRPLLILSVEEVAFFRAYLLIEHRLPAHPQNSLYALCESGAVTSSSSFFSILQQLIDTKEPFAATIAEDIRETELILCPLNHIFRALQLRRLWAMEDVAADEYFTACLNPVEVHGLRTMKAEKEALASILTRPLPDALAHLVMQNKSVAARRGGSEWMSLNGSLIEVAHTEGSFRSPEHYISGRDWDNSYFLHTYLNLHRQVSSKAV